MTPLRRLTTKWDFFEYVIKNHFMKLVILLLIIVLGVTFIMMGFKITTPDISLSKQPVKIGYKVGNK